MCTAQAVMFLFFFPASWTWSVALVYQLRCVLRFKKLWFTVAPLHFFCWGIPLVLLFLPLLTPTQFGQDDGYNGKSPCTLSGKDSKLWMTSFFSFFLLCFCSMVVITADAAFHLWRRPNHRSIKREIAVYNTVKLYPVASLIAWLPNTIFVASYNLGADPSYFWTAVSMVLTTQNGTLLALIFFTHSQPARAKWKALLYGPPRARPCPTPLSSESDAEDQLQHLIGSESGTLTETLILSDCRPPDDALSLFDKRSSFQSFQSD